MLEILTQEAGLRHVTAFLETMLASATKRFGPRQADLDLVYVGVTLGPGRVDYDPLKATLALYVSQASLLQPRHWQWEVAHEVIHLLGPPPPDIPVTVLEEGLAVYFASSMIYLAKPLAATIHERHYRRAGQLVADLLGITPQAIWRLRQFESCLSRIRPDDLRQVAPLASAGLVAQLTQPFRYPVYTTRSIYSMKSFERKTT